MTYSCAVLYIILGWFSLNWYNWQCINVKLNWAGEGKLRCPYCTYTTVQQSDHKKHLSLHLSKSSIIHCSQCGFSCSIKSQYEMHCHYALHTGEKIGKCPFCDFRTSDRSYFKKHLSIHTGKWCDTILVGYVFACGIICTQCRVIPRERLADALPSNVAKFCFWSLNMRDVCGVKWTRHTIQIQIQPPRQFHLTWC